MDLDLAYGLAIIVTLWATAIALGASHDLRAVRAAAGRRGRFARLVALDVLLVPLVVIAFTRLFAVPTEEAIGLVIVGTASAGPLGLKATQLARGDLPLAIGLVIVLELANVVAMPVWAAILTPGVSALPIGEIARTLVLGILVPLGLGFAIGGLAPRSAPALSRLSTWVSTAGLAAVIGIVLVRDGGALVDAAGSGVPAVAVASIVVSMALGWWLGGPDAASRRTGALVSSVRANITALAVVTTAYGSGTPATSAIVVFGLCSLVIVPVVAVALGSGRAGYDALGLGPRRSRSAETS